MKTKTIRLAILLILGIFIYSFRELPLNGALFDIANWGAYLFSVPFIYCMAATLSNDSVIANLSWILAAIWLGVSANVLLSKDFSTIDVTKIIVALIGTVITYFIVKRLDHKFTRKI